MDFKQLVPMVLSEDVLDVLMGSLLKSSVPPSKNVGMLPICITLDIIVAMVLIFKQCVMQACTSYSSLLLPLGGHQTRLLWKKPPFIQSYLSCHLVCIS